LLLFANSNEFIIKDDGIGKIKIGNKYSDFMQSYKGKYKVIHKEGSIGDYDTGVKIYENNKLIIYIKNKNWGLPPYVVKDIEIYSDKYKTSDGIGVGTTIKELLLLFPDIESDFDNESGSIVAYPKKYQTSKFLWFRDQIVFELILTVPGYERIIDANIAKDLSKLNGYVSAVKIYSWN
jgi:hypothetical protein